MREMDAALNNASLTTRLHGGNILREIVAEQQRMTSAHFRRHWMAMPSGMRMNDPRMPRHRN